MKVALLGVVLSCSLMSACCEGPPRIEPPYPGAVSGWKDRNERGQHILGEFVLRKNETTDNGKVQIRVIDLLPGKPCGESPQETNARAVLQLVNPSDGKVLCEHTFLERSSASWFAGCHSDRVLFSDPSVYIDAINVKDGWVHFILLDWNRKDEAGSSRD